MNTYQNLIETARRLPEGSNLRQEAEEQIEELRAWSPRFRNERAEAVLRRIRPAADAAWAEGAAARAQARAKKEAARRARQLARAAAQPKKGGGAKK